MTNGPRRAAAVLGGLALLAALQPPPAAAADPPAPAGGIAWAECPPELLDLIPGDDHLYDCATLDVPRDHADPGGPETAIDLVRRRAADPDRRIGPLVLASGGPGVPGAVHAAYAPSLFQQEVLDRFDLVGYNPRGWRADCFDSAEQEQELLARLDPAPLGGDGVEQALAAHRELGEACARNEGELLPHLSSTAAAHDLDLVRAALGEERLNFFGMSQAGLIGTVYADLYPERVRALVLDSPVDATRRTTRPLEYDRARAQGHEEALGAALELCAEAGDRCPFGGGDPRAAMTEIRDRLYQGPVEMPDGEVVTLGKLVTELRSALGVMPALSPVPLDGVFQRLAELHGQAGGPPSGAPGPAAPGPGGGAGAAAYPTDNRSAFYGINCADRPYPADQGEVEPAARQWEQEYPVFGRAQAYEQFPACASWPAPPESPYPGPSEPRTEEPPLVLSNRHDAPTPPAFAERMAGALDGRLIVVEDAFGHGALGTSRCADDAVTAYLTRLQAPPEESVCAPDDAPWPEGSA